MTNPNKIERAAIEAGALAAAETEVNEYGTVAYSGEYHARTWDEVPPSTQDAIIDKHRVLFRAAIAAYNAAKWQPIGAFKNDDGRMTKCLVAGRWHDPVAVADCTENYIHAPGPGEYSHWQPLPQPPEKKP